MKDAEGIIEPDVFVRGTHGKGIHALNLDELFPERTPGQGWTLIIEDSPIAEDPDGTTHYAPDARAASLVLTENEMLDLGMQLLKAAGTQITEEEVEGEPYIYRQTATVLQV